MVSKPAPVTISCIVSAIGVVAALFIFRYLSGHVEPQVGGAISVVSAGIISFMLYRFVVKVFGIVDEE